MKWALIPPRCIHIKKNKKVAETWRVTAAAKTYTVNNNPVITKEKEGVDWIYLVCWSDWRMVNTAEVNSDLVNPDFHLDLKSNKRLTCTDSRATSLLSRNHQRPVLKQQNRIKLEKDYLSSQMILVRISPIVPSVKHCSHLHAWAPPLLLLYHV